MSIFLIVIAKVPEIPNCGIFSCHVTSSEDLLIVSPFTHLSAEPKN